MGRVTGERVDVVSVARVEREALEAVKARGREAQARIADELLDALRRDEFFRELRVPNPLMVRIANAIAGDRGHAPLSRDREDRSRA